MNRKTIAAVADGVTMLFSVTTEARADLGRAVQDRIAWAHRRGIHILAVGTVDECDAARDDYERRCRSCRGGMGRHECSRCQETALERDLKASVDALAKAKRDPLHLVRGGLAKA